MKKNRRDFLKLTGTGALGLVSPGIMQAYACRHGTQSITNRVILEYANATLEDGSQLPTPFWRIDSGRDGPSLLLIAAQHGHEVQGAEVARRFKDICASQLVKGSVWLIPMANRQAMWKRAGRSTAEAGRPGTSGFGKRRV